MIFDTSFIIDVMNGDKNAVDKIKESKIRHESHLTTSITLFELYKGLSLSSKPRIEKEKIKKILKGLISLPLDDISAEKAGKIQGQLIRDGKRIEVADCMIAGIALNKNDTILTRNVKDFKKIKGLKIESY